MNIDGFPDVGYGIAILGFVSACLFLVFGPEP